VNVEEVARHGWPLVGIAEQHAFLRKVA
jgi:hypothetical protein